MINELNKYLRDYVKLEFGITDTRVLNHLLLFNLALLVVAISVAIFMIFTNGVNEFVRVVIFVLMSVVFALILVSYKKLSNGRMFNLIIADMICWQWVNYEKYSLNMRKKKYEAFLSLVVAICTFVFKAKVKEIEIVLGLCLAVFYYYLIHVFDGFYKEFRKLAEEDKLIDMRNEIEKILSPYNVRISRKYYLYVFDSLERVVDLSNVYKSSRVDFDIQVLRRCEEYIFQEYDRRIDLVRERINLSEEFGILYL